MGKSRIFPRSRIFPTRILRQRSIFQSTEITVLWKFYIMENLKIFLHWRTMQWHSDSCVWRYFEKLLPAATNQALKDITIQSPVQGLTASGILHLQQIKFRAAINMVLSSATTSSTQLLRLSWILPRTQVSPKQDHLSKPQQLWTTPRSWRYCNDSIQ